MKKAIPVVLAAVVVLVACGGARTTTERNMLEWGPLLNMYMATNLDAGNSYPETLDEIEPGLREGLSQTDGWGNTMLYRKLRIDLYNIISAGPDGEFGNDDDIVVQNGALYEPTKIYSEHPLER